MPDETQGVFCPECGALLIADERIEENGQIFILLKCGHKIPAALLTKRYKGRAVSLKRIYVKIY